LVSPWHFLPLASPSAERDLHSFLQPFAAVFVWTLNFFVPSLHPLFDFWTFLFISGKKWRPVSSERFRRRLEVCMFWKEKKS